MSQGYLRGCHTFPLRLPPTVPLNLIDANFQSLKVLETPPLPPPRTLAAIPQWMSERYLQLVDTLAVHCFRDGSKL